MNKLFITLAIFAVFLTPNVLAEGENRELASIPLGNLGNIIGSIINGAKNTTKPTNTTTTTPSTPVVNTTTPSTPSTPSTPVDTTPTTPTTPSTPVVNTTTPSTPSTPVDTTPTTPTTPAAPADSDASDNGDESDDSNSSTTTPATPAAWYARNDVDRAAFKDKCLVIHNILRQAVGVPDLTWSDSLAASAQAWAENMAANGFRHSGRTGENIASTTYSTKVTVRLLGLWTKEQDWFIKGCKYPKCSSNGNEVGHYTQMVWSKTTQVGCGFAPGVNKQWNYLCCQYYKAGNVIGQTVYPYTAPAV